MEEELAGVDAEFPYVDMILLPSHSPLELWGLEDGARCIFESLPYQAEFRFASRWLVPY